jgi:diguanylate cyclase (GGDEF)-like protein/PAS domain S-box-containing protein
MRLAIPSHATLLERLRGALFPASLHPALSDRIRGEQVRVVLRLVPFTILANIGNGAVVVASLWGWVPTPALVGWAAAVLLLAVLPVRSWLRMRKSESAHGVSLRSILRLTRNAMILGLVWAVLPLWFFHLVDAPRQFMIACVISGMMCGGAFALTTVPAAAVAYISALSAASFVCLAVSGEPLHLEVAGLFVLYGVVLVGSVIWSGRIFVSRLVSEAAREHQSQVIGLLLRDFEESTSDWLWETDRDGRLVHVSPRFAQIQDRTAHDLFGVDFCVLLSLLAHGDRNVQELRTLMAARATIRDVTVPISARGRDGWWSLTGKPIFDRDGAFLGYRGVGRDVTEARRAEDEIKHAHNFLGAVIENIPAAVWVKDVEHHRFMLINRAGEELLGLSRQELIGKSAEDLLDPVDAARIDADDTAAITSGEIIKSESPLATPHNGTRIVNSQKLAIADKDGRLAHVLTVIEDITDRKRTEARIDHLARHDPLTDLPNRVFFNERLAGAVKHAKAANTEFAVLTIDVDRFKEVNDVFGHAIGDAVLNEVCRRLRQATSDALFARMGGDEFALIVESGDQPAAAAAFAVNLQRAIADDIEFETYRVRVGLSIGVALYPHSGVEAGLLLANAYAALHRAKAEGNGLIRFYETNMDQPLRERRALQNELRTAIKAGQIELHYQPQARTSGEITGFEALARWRHPTRGLIAPNVFIPLAEESGLIVPIGEWILREACREAATWPRPLQIAVNLSPVQFRGGDLPGIVHAVLFETGVAADRLELEITENVLIGDFSRVLATLRQLKALGVRVALDDFGTGYSSLSYLHSFPFDKIKIDRSFIANVATNDQTATILRTVIGLARRLGIPVAAEGVETEAQLAFLAEEACDELQGYLIGRPLPIAEYAEVTGCRAEASKLSAVAR